MTNIIPFRRHKAVDPLLLMSLKLLTDMFEASKACPENDIAAVRAMIDNAERKGV